MGAFEIIRDILCVLSFVSFPIVLVIWISSLIKEKIQKKIDAAVRECKNENMLLKLMLHDLKRDKEKLEEELQNERMKKI